MFSKTGILFVKGYACSFFFHFGNATTVLVCACSVNDQKSAGQMHDAPDPTLRLARRRRRRLRASSHYCITAYSVVSGHGWLTHVGHMSSLVRQSRHHLGVAVQVAFESKGLKPAFHVFPGSRVETTRALSSHGPTAFNLCIPTSGRTARSREAPAYRLRIRTRHTSSRRRSQRTYRFDRTFQKLRILCTKENYRAHMPSHRPSRGHNRRS